MEKLLQTGEGLMSTLGDTWDGVLAKVGDRFQDLAKDKIKGLIDWLTKIGENGDLEKWVKNTVELLDGLGIVLKKVGGFFADFVTGWKALSTIAGKMSGGMSYKEAFQETADEMATEDFDREEKAKAEKEAARLKKVYDEIAAKDQKAKEELWKKKGIGGGDKITVDMETGAKLQSKIIEDALKEAKKDLVKTEREAAEYKMEEFKFTLMEAGKESGTAGKKRLEEEIKKYKDQLDIRKDLKQAQKQVREADAQREQKETQKTLEKAEKGVETWTAALARAQADRKLSVRDRRKKEEAQKERALNRDYSNAELDALRTRGALVGDLSKEEVLALKEQDKFMAKTEKLRERAHKGQHLSPDEKRLLAEANAQKTLDAEAEKKGLAADKLKEDQAALDEQQAEDIGAIREKIEKLLVLKDGG
jgi:hypothetical protein